MKTKELIKEANIGSVIELTNVELTLIKTKWITITDQLQGRRKLDHNLQENINHFTVLVDKLCSNVISLEETAEGLFGQSVSDEEMNDIIEASTASYTDLSDEERAERSMNNS